MIDTYSFSPYFALYFGLILHCFLMMEVVFFPNNYKGSKDWKNYLYDAFMHVGFGLFFLFGIIFFDTGIIWILGQWTYADWRFQLPAVILVTIIGFQYIVGTMLVNPKISDLIYFISSSITMFYFLHIYTIGKNLRYAIVFLLQIMVVLLVIYVLLWGIDFLLEKRNPLWRKKNKYLWDISDQFKKIFNRKVNLILWILLAIEALLKLTGSSLFIW